ncbi:MAG: PEP-CTERM sorting domain-containing protein, partial [Gemmatimonadetes bacterium]|nr:PEP-CTERM sorting domain-containing protein [Gemmatimonadota bacterium]
SSDPYLSVSNSLVAALNLQGVNLYYDYYNQDNKWLNDWIPDTGYDLWGGSLLLPIPEPSPLLAVGAGLALLALLRRRRV